MDSTTLNLKDHIVPLADIGAGVSDAPAATGVKRGGAEMRGCTSLYLVVAVLVVLVIVAAFIMWRRRYHSKPDCSKLTGDAAIMCQSVSAACKGDPACLNAASHCLPIASRLAGATSPSAAVDALAGFSERDLSACANSVARVNPKLIAGVSGACLPAEMAALAGMIPEGEIVSGYNSALAVATAAKPLVPWAIQVGKSLPACGGVSPGPGPVIPPH